MQPGAERALTAERRKPFPGAHEHILRQLACFLVAAQHAPAQRIDRRRMNSVKPLERVNVTLLRATHQVFRVGTVVRPGNRSLHSDRSRAHELLLNYRRAAALSV